jgi:lipooligosaccharide transport system permease protein
MRTPPFLRATESWAVTYRHQWRSTLFSTIVTPVLYLAAMGLGLGSLVNEATRRASLGGVDYLTFLAPGLLAAAAMQTAANESTWPVMASFKWMGTYKAMITSPLSPEDVALGHLLWMAIRTAITAIMFTLVIVAFGAVHSPWIILAIPAAVLTGMSFAAPITAVTASLDRDTGLSAIMRFGIIPMFLFSGTFFPVTQLPKAIRLIAYATPLWHGVDLCRSLSLGRATPARSLLHVAYLGAWIITGTGLAVWRLRRKLVL